MPRDELITNLTKILDEKSDIDANAPKTIKSLKDLELQYSRKVTELEAIEDKFN